MALVRVADASKPPPRPVPGCGGFAAYIGGSTPHAATAAEWNAASDNGRIPVLPIWVRDPLIGPGPQARSAALEAKRLGWAAHHGPPGAWRAIVADVEATFARDWLEAFGDELQAEGFLCWPYMSAVAFPSDPPGFTAWVAEWDGLFDIPPIHDVIGHQYAHDLPFLGTTIDLSAFEPSALASFGRGPRHG